LVPDPLVYTWPAGTSIHRCHDYRWGPADFFANLPGTARFSPFTPAAASAALPVLYGADDPDGALSETVLRNVPLRGRRRRIDRSSCDQRMLAELSVKRPLQIADLRGPGLGRLGLARARFVDSGSYAYPATALWARAIHAHPLDFDGLMWVSRQSDVSAAVMLFGDRVAAKDIELAAGSKPRPLAFGPGRDVLEDLCARAGIAIIDP
jgi:hypothetical protein